MENKTKILIGIGIVIALIALTSITIMMNSSSSKTEKAPEDMTISETIASCMETCKKLPMGSTRTNCEAGCSKVQEETNKVQTQLDSLGIDEDATVGEIEEKLSVDTSAQEASNSAMLSCLENCQTLSDAEKGPCLNSCLEN